MKRSDTIAAICTPYGKSGIGIIRISGFRSLEIASNIITCKLCSDIARNNRQLLYGYLLNQKGYKVDEILIAVMPPKLSYTGELTVELNCHGGIAIINLAVEQAINAGARLAEPGEFTRRAVENGRIDLIQAEAVNELINAESEINLEIATQQLMGTLSNRYFFIKEKLVSLVAQLINILDFEGEFIRDNILKEMVLIENELNSLLFNSENLELISRSRVVIYGAPNAGKSTIFNKILGVNRAIVTDKPGTTRDYLSENINLEKNSIKIFDTAGIRISKNNIEKIAFKNTLDVLKNSSLKILVLDQSIPVSTWLKEEANRNLKEGGIVVLNKCDLPISNSLKFLLRRAIQVSFTSQKTIILLRKKIDEKINNFPSKNSNSILLTKRQSNFLKITLRLIKKSKTLFLQEASLDIISFEINKCINIIDNMTGKKYSEEAMSSVFKNFCIGK